MIGYITYFLYGIVIIAAIIFFRWLTRYFRIRGITFDLVYSKPTWKERASTTKHQFNSLVSMN